MLATSSFPAAGVAPPLPPSPNPRLSAGAACSAWPEVLMEIARPELNLAIWDRRTTAPVNRYLSRLTAHGSFVVTAEGDIGAVLDAVAAQLPIGVVPDFMLDVQTLSVAFAAIARTGDAVRLRLEATVEQTCPRWHADAVGLRLLCTYRGPGTEFLPLAGGAATARGLEPEAAAPCPRARIPTGAIAILKGELHAPGMGCIHRSPPAAATGKPRLLLCLDQPG